MSMRTRAEEYLAMRRSLGFKLHGEGRMLPDFADQLDDAGQPVSPSPRPWRGRSSPASATPQYWRAAAERGARLRPPPGHPRPGLPDPARRTCCAAPSHRHRRIVLRRRRSPRWCTRPARSPRPLPAATFQALISLIAASGLRVGEALGPGPRRRRPARRPAHRDRQERPDSSGATASHHRQRCSPATPPGATGSARHRRPAFFITSTGHAVTAARGAANLRQAAGPGRHPPRRRTAPPQNPRPAPHLRGHTPCIGWYRDGVDVQAHLPVLSTFLGHSAPEATYWYLQAAPELLALAAHAAWHAHRPGRTRPMTTLAPDPARRSSPTG